MVTKYSFVTALISTPHKHLTKIRIWYILKWYIVNQCFPYIIQCMPVLRLCVWGDFLAPVTRRKGFCLDCYKLYCLWLDGFWAPVTGQTGFWLNCYKLYSLWLWLYGFWTLVTGRKGFCLNCYKLYCLWLPLQHLTSHKERLGKSDESTMSVRLCWE